MHKYNYNHTPCIYIGTGYPVHFEVGRQSVPKGVYGATNQQIPPPYPSAPPPPYTAANATQL